MYGNKKNQALNIKNIEDVKEETLTTKKDEVKEETLTTKKDEVKEETLTIKKDEVKEETLTIKKEDDDIDDLISKVKNVNIEDKFVIEPTNLDIINIEKLQEYIKKYISNRNELYMEKKSNLWLESIFTEWWIAKSINGKEIGAGNSPIDIHKDKIGIDVFNVCLNGNMTNEKSIMQNFTSSGKDLDTYFTKENYDEIVELFKKEYIEKILKVYRTYKLDELYYIGFISTKKEIYMTILKVNLDILQSINLITEKVCNNKKDICSINIKNMIKNDFGNIKLYKAKKRLELRLNKNILQNEHCIKLFP
tara:strand:+ start:4033 stop:4953 length:921 start_codon:yes stop_codon:yes gene_type:complete